MILDQAATALVLVTLGVGVGGLAVWAIVRRASSRASPPRISVEVIAERVRSVGKLVGLEVCAKEIATARAGWGWLPPLLLSQARLAMIFHFEKQYWVDLGRVEASDVEEEPGSPGTEGGTFRVRLPRIESALRFSNVTPYDIQNARVLGLVDVIPMTAERQADLMSRARDEAAMLFAANDARYTEEARRSIERHLASLLGLFGVAVSVSWHEAEPGAAPRNTASDAPPAAPPITAPAGVGRTPAIAAA
ncbi:MAG: DUF4230 domain-containing protein [Phycisphaerae bacterium]|nr:DUF4230 domain-containing protein [Phycisphaerae bacterium]